MLSPEPIVYKAAGILKGQYFPSTKFRKGILVTSGGDKLPCYITNPRLSKLLNTDSSLLESEQLWLCYPRVNSESSGFEFDLFELYYKPDKVEKVFDKIDQFTIAGEIQSVDESAVAVCIRRNIAPPPGQKHWKTWQPFSLTIQGQLPDTDAVGKFWELTCLRNGECLVIETAKLIGEPPQPHQFSNLKEFSATTATTTTTATAALRVETDLTTKATNPTKTPVASARPTLTPQQTIQKGDEMAISGKLEITIKINAFPDEVKTTQNAWKSFDIDCDGQVVTIIVKPKVFKKLEEAQANYPMWVAAITGKMGARTPDGFVLDSPSISTFERRPKESEPTPVEAVATQ